MAKRRADQLLVEQGLAESRTKAQALILAGLVSIAGRRIDKPGTAFPEDAELTLAGRDHPWVSRGGVKLAYALDHFTIAPAGMIALDIGASTGGFTDVLLANGAARVHAVDVGRGQLAWKLRQDPRVVVHEGTNARYLTREQVGETVDLMVMDVSFISATLVLPAAINAAFPEDRAGKRMVILVKPQFEVGRDQVGKGGIVRDPQAQAVAVDKVRHALLQLGAISTDSMESPILGAEGNREFLLLAHL